MLDGPKVGLIVLAIALALVGIGIYLYERRHARHRHDREPKRLPLFGTEQLSFRTPDGTITREEPRHAATPRPTPAPRLPAAPPHPPASAALSAPVTPPRPAAPRPAPYEPPRPTATPAGPATPPEPAPAPMASTPTIEHRVPTVQSPAAPLRRAAPEAGPAATAPNVASLALIDGETLRFTLPTDGTMEFLPGHLDVVAGPEAGREIRFMRAPGESEVEVTFGRSEGPPNRHVQILARTVSRRHAVMALIEEHWQLTNLSSTNPVVLNGRVLADNEVAPLLVEGDRIEMGEAAFVFRDG